ncbi:hypothetical protein F5141DRAFT_1211735 [Pisolithus sp. B1]|nr:hypothetical protein F5141DRAFT_1211735 [Pisolithus sp. B1]
MRVWHSNHNLELILSYFLDTVKEFGYIPMIMQSDPGTENFALANAQTLLCQMHDPTLEGYIQHWWMHTKKNIKPEIAWSQLCHHFSPGFKLLLNTGVDAGWYDPDNTLQLMVFCWHCDKRKVLPHGILELIYTCAEDYGALDFKVMVSPAAIKQVQHLYINPNHIIFDLVLHSLNIFIEECYLQLGCPSVGCTSTWNVYCDILDLMQHCMDVPAILATTKDHVTEDAEEVNLLPSLQDLHETEEANYLQVMKAFNHNEPNIPNEIDAAPTLLVVHFSSEDEDDEADKEDVNAIL